MRLVIGLDDARRIRGQRPAQYPRVAVEVDRRAVDCADHAAQRILVKPAFERHRAAARGFDNIVVEQAGITARADTIAADAAAAARRIDRDRAAAVCRKYIIIDDVGVVDADTARPDHRLVRSKDDLAAIAGDIGKVGAVIEDDGPRPADRQRAACALLVDQLRPVRNLQRAVVGEAAAQIEIVVVLIDFAARRERDIGQILRLVIRPDEARRIRGQRPVQDARVAVQVHKRIVHRADDRTNAIFVKSAFERYGAGARGFDDVGVEQARIIPRAKARTADAAIATRGIDRNGAPRVRRKDVVVQDIGVVDADAARSCNRLVRPENNLAAIAVDMGIIGAVIEDDVAGPADRQRATGAQFVDQLRPVRNLQRAVVHERIGEIKIIVVLVDLAARR